jgi:phytoene synthase
VDRDQLLRARASGRIDRSIRELLRFEVERARTCYRIAEPGIELLEPSSRACMRTAFRLYGGILDEIVQADYDVFARRATVPAPRRLRVAAAEQLRARFPLARKAKALVLPA